MVRSWRRARDLNPRGDLSPPTRLAGEHLRPLGQPSGIGVYGPLRAGSTDVHVTPGLRALQIEVAQRLELEARVGEKRWNIAIEVASARHTVLELVESRLRACNLLIGRVTVFGEVKLAAVLHDAP